MGRIIFILLLLTAIPWAVTTWWRMHRARSERERSFIARTHMAVAIFTVLAVVAFVALSLRGQLFALPLIGVAGLAMRHGIRKARARIQAEQSDPLSRAKQIH